MQTPIILHADPEHSGLQATIPILLVASVALSCVALMTIFPLLFGGNIGQYVLLAACSSVLVGLGITAGVDRLLKRYWRSGRRLTYDGSMLSVRQSDEGREDFDLERPFDVVRWCFKLESYPRFGRERQIKNGWYCFAYQVQQDEARFIVHTFANPRWATRQMQDGAFQQIHMDKIYEIGFTARIQQLRAPKGRPEIPPSLIMGDKGQYWIAERRRWKEGLELTPQDFQTFVEIMAAHKG